jgi:toxin CptA
MHSAPSVNHPVGRSLLVGALILSLQAAVFGSTLGFWSTGAQGWRLAAVAVLAVASILASTFAWLRTPGGVLCWDGATWSWARDTSMQIGRLSPVLDLQSLMLVQWKGEVSRQWLWLEKGSDATHWHAVRRAVYSRARPDALQGATSPAATP